MRISAAALILAGVFSVSAEPLFAQQAPDREQPSSTASPTPAAAATPTSSTPTPQPDTQTGVAPLTSPSATTSGSPSEADLKSKKVIRVSKDYIKRLRNIGYYPKNDHGQLVFCRKAAPLGTRFERETCMDGEQLAMILEKNQEQRDGLNHVPCLGPPVCGKAP